MYLIYLSVMRCGITYVASDNQDQASASALALASALAFYVKVFYVMGKALSGELSCPCDRSCLDFLSQKTGCWSCSQIE